MLHISCWNVNGWTKNNCTLRETIIKGRNSDIICLCETHFVNDNMLHMDNYTWYGLNRKFRNVRAPKGSGGVGIIIKDDVIQYFNVSVIDQVIDGILGILLVHKVTHVHIAVFVYRHVIDNVKSGHWEAFIEFL